MKQAFAPFSLRYAVFSLSYVFSPFLSPPFHSLRCFSWHAITPRVFISFDGECYCRFSCSCACSHAGFPPPSARTSCTMTPLEPFFHWLFYHQVHLFLERVLVSFSPPVQKFVNSVCPFIYVSPCLLTAIPAPFPSRFHVSGHLGLKIYKSSTLVLFFFRLSILSPDMRIFSISLMFSTRTCGLITNALALNSSSGYDTQFPCPLESLSLLILFQPVTETPRHTLCYNSIPKPTTRPPPLVVITASSHLFSVCKAIPGKETLHFLYQDS